MKLLYPIVAAALLCTPALCIAAEPANFTGTWEINTAKSQFGDFLPLTKLRDTIEQTPSELRIHRTQSNGDRDVVSDIVYKFGEETVQKLPTGETRTSARWDGAVLIVELNLAASIHLHVVDRWSLSPDGRTIEITRQYGNESGSMKQTLILEKK